MLRKHWPFVLAVGLQAAIVAGVIVRPGFSLWTGTTVFLQAAPVDPYNIMSGYHVVLSYEISDPARLPGPARAVPGSRVYVTLREDPDGIWRAQRTSDELPRSVAPGMVPIRGRCESRGRVVYGIESFFVPEGKGQEIERGLRGAPGEARAEVRVDASGRAVLRRLHIGDKTYDY